MTMQNSNRRQALQKIGVVGVCASSYMGSVAWAGVFMDETQAHALLHPQAEAFQVLQVTLDEPTLTAIARSSDTRIPRGFNPKCWRAVQGGKTLGWVMSDRVIGKYDLIDYAAGFDGDGTTRGIEILAYRESHGAEVRQTAWRKQFAGKKGPGAMRFADDIRNISGATLFCQHVTEGMQRLGALALVLAGGR
jgi:hypothetical protein